MAEVAEAQASETDETEPLDLQYLRDLLVVLSEFKVKSFALGNLGLTFHDADSVEPPFVGRTPDQVELDENRSTSSRQVKGFDGHNIWKNPALWPAQGGRPLRFDGGTQD